MMIVMEKQMVNTKKRENSFSISNVLTYLIAFFFLLGNGTVYTHMVGYNHLDAFITYAPFVLIIALLFTIRLFNGAQFRKAALLVSFLALYLLFYFVLSSSNLRLAIPELLLVVCIVFYYMTVEINGTPKIFVAYRNIIYIVALVSLFFWIFGSLLGILQPTSEVISNWGTTGTGVYNSLKSYFGLYYELDRTYIFGRFIVCNRSIFVERAFASFSFGIGWIYELFIEKNKSKYRLTVFSVAMISTLSMTGLIVVIITYLLFYIFNGANDKLINLFRIMLIPVVLLLGYVGVSYLLDTKMSMGHSYSSRMSDFLNGFSVWLNRPIMGYGFGNGEVIRSIKNTGYSNSISPILTQGGIVLAIPYIICFAKGLAAGIRTKDINKSLFVAVFLVMFIFTAVSFINSVIYLLLFMIFGLDNRTEDLNNQ